MTQLVRQRFLLRASMLATVIAAVGIAGAQPARAADEVTQERLLNADKPVTEDEFTKARLGIIRGFPPSFETPGQVLRRLLDLVHYGLPDDYFSHHVSRLDAVTLDDVHRVSAGHVDPLMLSIIVVGDRKVIEPGLLELNLPIVHLDYEGRPLE